MKFSKKKFQNLSNKRQNKKIIEYIYQIERNWDNTAKKADLLLQFSKCLTWMNLKFEDNLTTYSLREFLSFAVPLEQKMGINLKDSDIIIQQKDGMNRQYKHIPLVFILDNLRSSFNVGSIFRTAECFKISKLYLCGYTPLPENTKVQKTAMGTIKNIVWQHHKLTMNLIAELKKKGYKIYALETTENAKTLNETIFEKPAALLLGNEALGIDKSLLSVTDEIIKIPMFGWKNSLNVATAAAIGCYEISNQWR